MLACIESPQPGVTTTAVVSAADAISTSIWPTPTVSTITTPMPAAPSRRTASGTASDSPPRCPACAMERMKTVGSSACWLMRTRSPRIAPPLKGDVGSTARTATCGTASASCLGRGPLDRRPSPAHRGDEAVGQRRLARSGRTGQPEGVGHVGAVGELGHRHGRVAPALDVRQQPRQRDPVTGTGQLQQRRRLRRQRSPRGRRRRRRAHWRDTRAPSPCSDATRSSYPRRMWWAPLTTVVALGHQPGQHERHPGPDVGRPHRRARELRHAAHDGVVPLGPDVGTHAPQLLDVAEPAREQVLGQDAHAVGHREHRHQQRRVVGGHARVRQRRHVGGDAARPSEVARKPSGPDGRDHAHLADLAQQHLHVLGAGVGDGDVTARHAHRGQERRRHHPVRHHRVCTGAQRRRRPRLRSVTSPRRAPTAPIAQSIDARSATSGSLAAFSITVVPLANAAAISRLSVAVWLGYSKTTLAPTKRPPGTDAAHLAVRGLEARAHGRQPVDVEVDRPVAEVVAARQRHPHRAAPGQQQAQHDDRRAHLLEQLGWRLRHQRPATAGVVTARSPFGQALDLTPPTPAAPRPSCRRR